MKTALIGYGYWGKILARNLDTHSAFDLVAIHTRTPIDDPRYQENLDIIITDRTITMIVIATPLRGRHILIDRCLKAGKNILTEKPLTDDARITQKFVTDYHDHHPVLMCNYVHSYAPCIDYILQEENFKKPDRLEVIFHQNNVEPKGEGVETLLLSHCLAISYRMMGDVQNWTIADQVQKDNFLHRILLHSDAITLSTNLNAPEKQRIIRAHYGDRIYAADFGASDGQVTLNGSILTHFDNSRLLHAVFDDVYDHIKNGRPATNHLNMVSYCDRIIQEQCRS